MINKKTVKKSAKKSTMKSAKKSAKKSRTTKISKVVKPHEKSQLRAENTPVTVAHLNEFKKEINSKVTSLELTVKSLEQRMEARFIKMESRFTAIDSRFTAIEARFTAIEARFTAIEARFTSIDARFTKIDATLEKMMELYHRQSVRFEEQAASNKIVFDHLNMLYERQEKLEKDTDQKIKNIQDAHKGF
jgi:chromosome segregation ATPase